MTGPAEVVHQADLACSLGFASLMDVELKRGFEDFIFLEFHKW